METLTKTHWKKLFNYDYLGSYSFTTKEDKILTIKSLKKEDVTGTGGKKENLLVCRFKENEKPMILNRTNCKAITKAYGTPNVEDWIGKRIAVYVLDGIKVGNEVTDGLRIRSEAPGEEITLQMLEDLAKEKEMSDKERGKVEAVIIAQDRTKYKAVYDFLKSKI